MNTSRPDVEKLRAAIGPHAEHYLGKFAKIDAAGGGWVAGWSWPAFFCSSGWFAYRRMGLYSLLNFLLPLVCVVLILMVGDRDPKFAVLGGYLVVAFVLMPVYADAAYYRFLNERLGRAAASGDPKRAEKLLRPPSAVTSIEGFLTGVLSFLSAAALAVAPALYTDFGPRAQVSEAVSMAGGLAREITEFRANNGRMPEAGEAGQFRRGGNQFVRSIAYDPGERAIVVTMESPRLKGKRFVMRSREQDGTLFWNCRPLDIEREHMPGACRE